MTKLLLKLFSLVLLLLVVTSCSPVYKVAHDYKPPSTKRGLICLQGCQSQLKQCSQRCSVKYNNCSIKATSQAKKRLPKLLQAYPQKLEQWLNAKAQYQSELDWYEFRLDMARLRRDQHITHCVNEGKKKSKCTRTYGYYLTDFPYSRPSFSVPRPKKPTLEGEASKIRQLNCSTDCGCQSSYRLCYTSCGGVVNSKKVCIKNCGN